MSVSGVVVALVCARHTTSHTDGTSRGKHDWVHALWQPCSFLTISCLQIPEYFTIFWKKKKCMVCYFMLRCQRLSKTSQCLL